jgi:hypothetical protein
MIKENKVEVLKFFDYYRFDTFLNFNNSKIRLNKWKILKLAKLFEIGNKNYMNTFL